MPPCRHGLWSQAVGSVIHQAIPVGERFVAQSGTDPAVLVKLLQNDDFAQKLQYLSLFRQTMMARESKPLLKLLRKCNQLKYLGFSANRGSDRKRACCSGMSNSSEIDPTIYLPFALL